MPVAILGMHRSGTSLLAQMLHRSGLYLGPEARLLGPGFDNPEGFWEHTGFLRLNEAVLSELGGAWNVPPVVPAQWEENRRVADHVADAKELLDEFSGREPWGWKDPRTSLTLSLWLGLVPDLKVILCLRNPLEVACSLHRRDGLSYSDAIQLWQVYNDRALEAPAASRIVVSYEQTLSDARAELARVLKFLGLPVDSRAFRAAAGLPRNGLRHIRFGLTDLRAAGCRADIFELYARLRAEAGQGRPDRGRAPDPGGSGQIVDERAMDAMVARRQPEPAPDDTQQVIRIRELVMDATPAGSTIAVISKGDERLIDLCGRRAVHFPQDEAGVPLGYHPSSGRSAVIQLETVRARGADYLLIPGPSLWWLEHYQELRQHLVARYHALRWEPATGALFDIRVEFEPANGPEGAGTHAYLYSPERCCGAVGAHERGKYAR